MSVDRLRKAFDKAVQAAEKRSDVLGRLGKVEPGGSVTLMADRPGHVHVRLGPEGTLGNGIARNAANVPLRAHLPVRMRRVNGTLVIVGLDYEGGRLEAAIANDTNNVFGLTRHHHRIGSGMEYEVEALLLEPGRVRPHDGMQVWINAFFYSTAAGRAFWPGGALDLTPYKPGAGQWAWVLVGVDPATNEAVAAAGDEAGSAGLLTTPMLADIDLGDALPCGGVKVSGDDTAITSIARFADAREWLNRGGGGGALGDLSDVDLDGLADDDILQYDAGSGLWQPAPLSSSPGGSAYITDWSYRSSARSTSAFAWKGNEFTPDRTVYLLAIAYYGGLVAGATYQAAIVTGDGSPGNVATITKSATVTLPGSLASSDGGWVWLYFSSEQTLSAGTTYGLMVGRTDSADTYALPLPGNGGSTTENAVPMTGASHGRNWRIAKANPQVGDAINLNTGNTLGAGYMFRY